MLDHIEITVSDLAASRAFYDKALAPLGISIVKQGRWPDGRDSFLGYGAAGKPFFFLIAGPPFTGFLHAAFTAKTRALVHAFYDAAIAAGGRDNGAPGPRSYHPNYYGAFVRDPDGHNIEAVCHDPE